MHLDPTARTAALMVLLLGVGGCPSPDPEPEPLEPLVIPEGCQPLAAELDCMLPYPSDYFLVEDSALPSGHRVALTSAAKPMTDEGYSADVSDLHPFDGFSTTNPIVALLDGAASDAGLTGIFDDYAATLSASSPTLIVDTSDGALVPHFVDIDPRAEDRTRAAIVLRPQIALKPETRYVVALQGVVDADGNVIAPSEGFRRLRDAEVNQDPALAALGSHYAEVFSALSGAGVDTQQLQLAWDFTTGSELNTIGDMLRVREIALDWLDATPPSVTIEEVTEDPDDARLRVVRGSLEAPRVMEADGAGQLLARDDDGVVKMNGTTTLTFYAVVPRSAVDHPGRRPVMVFGHGFFGGAAGASTGEYDHQLLEETGAVGIMTDWLGMAGSDTGDVIATIGGQVWQGLRFGDRVHQGVVNQLTLIHAVANGWFDGVEGFAHPADNGPLLDSDNITYFGISNGHILGGLLMPLDVHIEKWALQVGGASFSQMMYRARPFNGFLTFLNLRVPDALDQQKVHAQFQPSFDRFDGARFARYLDEDLPLGPPDPRGRLKVLMQYGVGDASVPNFATMLHARLLGVPLMTPSARTPWGLDEVTASSVDGRALTVFDVGYEDDFYAVAMPPIDNNPVHDRLRRTPQARAQVGTFITGGVIVHPCEGPCEVPLP